MRTSARPTRRGSRSGAPTLWAERFAAAGARYVVLVTKHHDGYCLWPSRVANPRRPGWACPRDLVGELAAAVRARGMRFGVYYSAGLDWTFDGRRIAGIGDLDGRDPARRLPGLRRRADARADRARAPDVLWNDIAWPGDQASFYRLVADYYNAIPEGVINDRWLAANWLTRAMKLAPVRAVVDRVLTRAVRKAFEKPDAKFAPPPPPHYDARTPEYAVFSESRREKWECVRGMDKSFGYNRMSRPEDFLSREALIHSLADITSKNGNLLLNVGPRGEDAADPRAAARAARLARELHAAERRGALRHAPVAARRGHDGRGHPGPLHAEGRHALRAPARPPGGRLRHAAGRRAPARRARPPPRRRRARGRSAGRRTSCSRSRPAPRRAGARVALEGAAG